MNGQNGSRARALTTVSVLALATLLSAAEDTPERAQAKKLHQEAQRAGELWTIVQLEDWAEAHDLKLRPALPGLTVHGRVQMAFPEPIYDFADRGADVAVLTSSRCHLVAGDGRPLALPVHLPFLPDIRAWSTDDHHVAIASRTRNADLTWEALVASLPLPGATPNFVRRWKIEVSDYIHSAAISDDGSAVMVGLTRQLPKVAAIYSAQVVLGDVMIGYPDLYAPLAIGRRGAWLCAHNATGWILGVGAKRLPIDLWVAGGGVAVVRTKVDKGTQLLAVGPDGVTTPFDPGIGMGPDTQLLSIGRWLVVASGHGALAPPSVDLLGKTIPGGQPQPPTIALFRWSDLAVNSAAPATQVIASPLAVASTAARSLWLWRGNETLLLDLSADVPVERPFLTMDTPVVAVYDGLHRIIVAMEGGTWSVQDTAKRELWRGKADSLSACARDWAVAMRGGDKPEPFAVRLAVDAKDRLDVPIGLETAGPWRFSIDYPGATGLCVLADGSWRRFLLPSGELAATGGTKVRPPVLDQRPDYPGRFVRTHARLLDKATAEAIPPMENLQPIDAQRRGRSLLILDRQGTVFSCGSRGDCSLLGTAPGAVQLAQIPQMRDALVIVDANNKPLAGFTAKGTLS
ncbi:MAG: hypothetical protein H0W72_15655, partial [Planctomycetes bacterium]|nr:hypothetical protein [Planctomycetota bacterium]